MAFVEEVRVGWNRGRRSHLEEAGLEWLRGALHGRGNFRDRRPRKLTTERRADRIGDLAGKISVPSAAWGGVDQSLARTADGPAVRRRPFVDPDPCGHLAHAGGLDARRGVSDLLHRPLVRLGEDDFAPLNALVERTLDKAVIERDTRTRFLPRRPGAAEGTSQC